MRRSAESCNYIKANPGGIILESGGNSWKYFPDFKEFNCLNIFDTISKLLSISPIDLADLIFENHTPFVQKINFADGEIPVTFVPLFNGGIPESVTIIFGFPAEHLPKRMGFEAESTCNPGQGMLVCSGESQILMYNDKVLEMLGIDDRYVSRNTLYDAFLSHLQDACTRPSLPFEEVSGLIHKNMPFNFSFSNQKGQVFEVNHFPIPGRGFMQTFAETTGKIQLEKKYRQFKTISDKAGYGIAITDTKGAILYGNEYLAGLHGYNTGELEGRDISLLLDRHELKKLPPIYRQILKKGSFQPTELVHRHKDGYTIPMLVSGVLIKNEPGFGPYLSFSAMDLRPEKEIRKELKISRSKLYKIINSIPAHVLMLDRSYKIIWANERLNDLFDEDITGQYCYKVFRNGENICKDCIAEKTFLDGKNHEMEYNTNTPKGTKTMWCTTSVVKEDENGMPLEIIEVARDITQRKAIEKALSESERKFHSLFENLVDGFAYCKIIQNEKGSPVDYKFLEVNYAFEKLIGIQAKDIKGKRFSEVFTTADDLARDWIRIFGTVAKTQGHVRLERYCSGFGKWLRVTAYSREKGYFAVIYEDVSEQKRIERELKQAKEAAVAADIAKSEFLANMSHEIRTPMNAILGFADILKNDETDPEKLEDLDYILASGKHLLDLINDILDLSKIEAGKLNISYSVFSVSKMLDEIYSLFNQKTASKGIYLKMENTSPLPETVRGDIRRIKQIILNLVSNAVKFTDEGGITIISGYKNGILETSVKDTGIGIAAEDQPKIFSAFEQVGSLQSKNIPGTGLGLAICYKLAELMNGSVGVQSAPGQGSCFWLRLPAKEEAAKETVQAPISIKESNTGSHSSPKILVAEDNLVNQKLMQVMMTKLNLSCDHAQNGKIALEMLDRGSYGLLFLDIQMPVMDGMETIGIIRSNQKLRNLPVVALTAYAMKGDAEKYISAGCDDYLSKPVQLKDLKSKILKFMKRDINDN